MADLVDRFFAKVSLPDDPNSCWIWIASTAHGYGQIYHEGTNKRAHRVSWEIFFGAIPDGMCVLHRCDNPPCVNPWHLFLGTHLDNVNDRHSKGRSKGKLPNWSKTHPEWLKQ